MISNKRKRDTPTNSFFEYERAANSSCTLCLESGSVTFVCGTHELPVSQDRVQRSELIGDLLQQYDSCRKELPIPLSLEEARAWLEVSVPASVCEAGSLAETEEAKFLQALKVGSAASLITFTRLHESYM